MATLKLNIDTATLKFNSAGELDVRISSDAGNTLHHRDGGLYAAAPAGAKGGSGSGYSGYYETDQGTVVGYTSPYQVNHPTGNHSIHCKLVIHRTWTSTEKLNGTVTPVLKEFRSNIDYVFPGDLIYDGTDYWVITSIKGYSYTEGGTATSTGGTVDTYAKL